MAPTRSKQVGSTGRPKPPNAGKGRPKGVPNKVTGKAKEAIALAFEGLGGVPRLKAWADENLTEFYKLWARLIPTEVTGDGGGPVVVRLEYVETDE